MTLEEVIKCLTNPNIHELVLPPNQLAEWLQELELLREKHWDECRQIAHYDEDTNRALSLTIENMELRSKIRELNKLLKAVMAAIEFLRNEGI